MDIITAKNIKKTYPSFTLDMPDITIKEGYVTGVVGQNGAGKTTMLSILLGLIPAEGSVEIFGGNSFENHELRQDISLVSEAAPFPQQCTPAQIKHMTAPFYRNWNEAMYDALMAEFAVPNNKLRQLSKGQSKIFSFIMGVCTMPRLLILDEPTANLDPVVRHRVLQILRDITQDEKRSVLFSTHITSDLDIICDYLIGVKNGKIAFYDEKDKLLETYCIVQGANELLTDETASELVGAERTSAGFTALFNSTEYAQSLFGDECIYKKPTIEDLLLYSVLGVK